MAQSRYEIYGSASAVSLPVADRHSRIGTFFGTRTDSWRVPPSLWPAPPRVNAALLRSVSLSRYFTTGFRGAIDYRYRQPDAFDSLSFSFPAAALSEPSMPSFLIGLAEAFGCTELYCDPGHCAVDAFFAALETGRDPRTTPYCFHQFWYVARPFCRSYLGVGTENLPTALTTSLVHVQPTTHGVFFASQAGPITPEHWHARSAFLLAALSPPPSHIGA